MLGVERFGSFIVMFLLELVQMTSIYFEWTENRRSFVSVDQFENWEIIFEKYQL